MMLDDKTPIPGEHPPDVADFVSEAKQKCLAAHVLAETLVSKMEEDPPGDSRMMALAYAIEEQIGAACEAAQKAGLLLL